MPKSNAETIRRAFALSAERVVANDTRDPEIVVPMDDEISQDSLRNRHSSKKRTNWKVVGPKYIRPRPRRGWPLVLYWIEQFLRLFPYLFKRKFYFSNPKLSKKDRLMQRYDYLKENINERADRRHRSIAMVNSGGGVGKTPTSTNFGAVAQKVAKCHTLFIDMNQNTGNAGIWLNILKSRTLTLEQARHLNDEGVFQELEDITARTSRHRETGMRVILSEDMDADEKRNDELQLDDLNEEELRAELQRRWEKKVSITNLIKAFKRFYQLIIKDTGNGWSNVNNLVAIETSDVVIFPAQWDKDKSVQGIHDSINGYIDRGFGNKIRNQSLYVMLGTKPRRKREDLYVEFCNRLFAAFVVKTKGYAVDKIDPVKRQEWTIELIEQLNITPDRFFVIPYSKWIADENIVSAKKTKMGLAAKVGYMEVINKVFETDIVTDSAEDTDDTQIEAELAGLFSKISIDHKE